MGKFLIGLIAEKGAGKGLCVKILKELLPHRRIAAIRFSDPLREVLAILDKEESRSHLQALATALRESFHDEGILTHALLKRIRTMDADCIILDGVRKKEEAAFVKSLGGILIYITADQKIRFRRRKDDPENADEREMTWEQFLRQDAAQTEISIREVGATMSDVTIENDGTIGELREEIENIIKEFLH